MILGFVNTLLESSHSSLTAFRHQRFGTRRLGEEGRGEVLEITCQDSEVTVVPLNELRVIRVRDLLAGITINIPLTAAALASLVLDEAIAA